MRLPITLCCSALLLGTTHAIAGDIGGVVTDENGQPLEKVLVCLQRIETPGGCDKTRATNKKGQYSFKGIAADVNYRVSVSAGTDLATRRANPFPNYVWGPRAYDVTLNRRNDSARGRDFSGSFNFSNYQQTLKVTSTDLPLLADYDLTGDYVYLKLYARAEDGSQNLIFLGQVTNSDTLAIDISVPLSTDVLFYEVYSLNRPEPVTDTVSLSS